MKQLRGETAEAVQAYVAFRFAENAHPDGQEDADARPEVQKALDVYATYFLGTCHLEQKDAAAGRVLLREDARAAPRARPAPALFLHVPLGRPGRTSPGSRRPRATRPGDAYYSPARPDPPAARQPPPRPRPRLARPGLPPLLPAPLPRRPAAAAESGRPERPPGGRRDKGFTAEPGSRGPLDRTALPGKPGSEPRPRASQPFGPRERSSKTAFL